MITTIRATELAQMLGLSPRRLRELAAAGVIVRCANGRYPTTAIATYCKYLREQAAGRASNGADTLNLATERALLVRARRLAIEQKTARIAAKQVNAHEVKRPSSSVTGRSRDR
jgi:phage terminase Nu1 subunit (DNA packaging protein)